MNTDSILFLLLAMWPFVLFWIPIDHISGNFLVCCQSTDPRQFVWASLLVRFYSIYFFIMATTWIYVLEREVRWTNRAEYLGIGMLLAAFTTGLTRLLQWVQPSVTVTRKLPKDVAPAQKPNAATPIRTTQAPEKASFGMATWAPPLCVTIAYNAMGTTQYEWNPALRASLYICVVFVASVLGTRAWVTDTPYANAWNVALSAVFELSLCMYVTQITQLLYREANQEENVSLRWNEVGVDSTAFIGFTVVRVVWLLVLQRYFTRWWINRSDTHACCCRRKPMPSARNGGTQGRSGVYDSEYETVCSEEDDAPEPVISAPRTV